MTFHSAQAQGLPVGGLTPDAPVTGQIPFFKRRGVRYWWNGSLWVRLPADPLFSSVTLLQYWDYPTNGTFINRGTGPVISSSPSNGGTPFTSYTWDQTKFSLPTFIANTSGGGYLSAASSAAWNYGTADFSIELWLYPNATTGTPTLWDQRPGSNGVWPTIYFNASTKLSYFVSSADRITGTQTTCSNGAWHFIQLIRSGGTTNLWVDTVQQGSNYTDANNYGTTTLLIANNIGNTFTVNGYLGPIRVTKAARPVEIPTMPWADY